MAKILLYVRNPENLARYLDELIKHEHELIVSTDGREACKKLHAHKPDIVVVDYDMPRRCGVEFSIYLRDQGVSTPVIIFSGGKQQSPGQSRKHSGSAATIAFDELASLVNEMIKQHKREVS